MIKHRVECRANGQCGAPERDLRHDYAERRNGVNDQADISRDKADIRSDRKDIQADHKDIARDRADIRADQRDMRTDRQDLRADRGDLRNDRGNLHTSVQDGRRNDVQDQRGKRMDGVKPAISSATLANNTAENNKKAQAAQHLHKAWYHFW